MQKRNVLNSPRLLELKKRRRIAVITRVLAVVVGVAAVVGLLSYISRLGPLNINDVRTNGNNIIDAEVIRQTAEEEMSGNYLWLFPKTNIFFYPKSGIKTALEAKFKRLKNIEVSIDRSRVLIISTGERSPQYTWCGTLPPEKGAKSKTCYFMDDTGYIFDVAPYFSGEVYFKFYGTTVLHNEDPSGSYFFQQYFNKLLTFKDTLSNLGLDPAAYYLTDDGDAKLLLSPATPSSTIPEILFKADDDVEKVAENLHASLSTEPLQTDFKKKYSTLLYIDLRYGNKVFYKFQ